MKIILSLFLTTALFSTGSTLCAQSNLPATEFPVAATVEVQKKNPFRGTISGLNPAAGTFTFTNGEGKVKTYTLAKEASLLKDGKPITFADVKVGDYVRGSCLKSDEGRYQVFSATIGPKTDEEREAGAKEKAEKRAKANTPKQ